ncbi:MAG: hypothetical protein WC728_03200 [Elusimicrobiota bacterium]
MKVLLLSLIMAFFCFGQEEPAQEGAPEAPPEQEEAAPEEPKPKPKPKRKPKSKKVTVWPNENLYWIGFSKNTEKLSPTGSKRLDEAIRILAAFPHYEVKLRAFAPAKALARKRAAAVRDLLTSWRPKPEENLGLKLYPIEESRIEVEVKTGPRSGVELEIIRRLWRRGP